MKKIFFLLLLSTLLISSVSAYELTRTISSEQVLPGESFVVNYSVPAIPDLIVSWKETISGNCVPKEISYTMSSNLENSKSYIISTSQGDCTISGYYFFQDGITKFLPTKTIHVGLTIVPLNLTNQTIPQENIPINNTETTKKYPIREIISSFSFLHILDDFTEGMITFIIFTFVIYKLLK